MKQTRMKSFVEQSERHYVSVPRHHLWSRIYIILRVLVFHICCVYVSVCISICLRVSGCVYVCVSVYYDTLSLSFSLSLIFSLIFSLSFFRSDPHSLFSFLHSYSPALSRSFRCTRSSRPPFFLPLTFRVRSLDEAIRVFLRN